MTDEATALERDLAKANARIRKATQRLVEVMGAEGPMDLEEMIERVIEKFEQERHDGEERGAFWCLKAGARVVYSVDNNAYWLLAREVCDKARKERGDDY